MLAILALSSAEHIAIQILVIAKLNRQDLLLKGCVYDMILSSKQLPFTISN